MIVGFGELLRGPLKSLNHTESGLNADLAQDRTPAWNTVTMVWSHIGNTEIVIGVCVVAVALLWWRTRQWWVAVVPAIAISLQATIFVIATAIIGRPRPEVPKLDPAPPTSSYPSGHVGASTALYLSFALHRGPADRAGVAAPAGRRRLRRDPVPGGLRPAVPRHAPPLRRADRRAQRHRLRPAGVDLPAHAPRRPGAARLGQGRLTRRPSTPLLPNSTRALRVTGGIHVTKLTIVREWFRAQVKVGQSASAAR